MITYLFIHLQEVFFFLVKVMEQILEMLSVRQQWADKHSKHKKHNTVHFYSSTFTDHLTNVPFRNREWFQHD